MDLLLYLSREDVENVDLPIDIIIDTLEQMFVEKGRGNVEMPPKPGIHTLPDAFIHAMPAYIPKFKSAGMKWVSGYPDNPKSGLPYISGLLILNDYKTGIPYCVMDCTWITAKRTGAATAIAAKYLARQDSESVGIVACGVQGRSNLEALCSSFKIKTVKAYDINHEIAINYSNEMSRKFNVDVEPVIKLEEAVKNLDIIVTSGPILKNPDPLIEPGWMLPGSFACPVDFDSYWQGDAFMEADKLATDDMKQFHYYKSIGYFKDTPTPYADIGELAVNSKVKRESDDERNICINLGLALEDMATAIKIYNKALEMGIGTKLPL